MQGNQFPSSNENINIQLRLSPLILLSEGLEKEANELSRQERCFFFEEWCLKGLFFFFPDADRRGGKKYYSSSSEGKIEGLNPRGFCSLSPLVGSGPGASRKRPGPTGKTGSSFGYPCPFKPPPSTRRAAADSSYPEPPGRRPPQPGRQRAPSGARPGDGPFLRLAAPA